MNIAIASSGLGHVARGIESWAWDTACALAGQGGGGAGELGSDLDVTLFSGATVAACDGLKTVALPCLRRGTSAARRLARLSPPGAWRWGLKNPYGWEQLSFWLRLWPQLRRGRFDILHVQDPMLAGWCRAFRRRGLVRTKEILAHGTEEPSAFLARFEHVQHLAPWHLQQALAAQPAAAGSPRHWTAIPNFVDCRMFAPVADAATQAALRAQLGLPARGPIIGCVAVVKKDHKRIDYLIREFADACRAKAGAGPFLLVAGARTAETDDLARLAEQVAPGQVRILTDQPRDRMPDLYRALDLFVLPSLFEMLPIALLEALASGVPIVTHRHPVLAWVAGEGEAGAGGACIDMAAPGVLARFLRELTPAWLTAHAGPARARALQMFAQEAVIAQYVDLYRAVMTVGSSVARR